MRAALVVVVAVTLSACSSDDGPADPLTTPGSAIACDNTLPWAIDFEGSYSLEWKCERRTLANGQSDSACDPSEGVLLDVAEIVIGPDRYNPPTVEHSYQITIGALSEVATLDGDLRGLRIPVGTDAGVMRAGGSIRNCQPGVVEVLVAWRTSEATASWTAEARPH